MQRIQADSRMDITVGMHWLACDATKHPGTGEVSARETWPVTSEALRQARRRMETLGHFNVESGQGRGKATKYTRIVQSGDTTNTKMEERASKATGTEERLSKHTAWEQEKMEADERQRRERYAVELGLNPDTGEEYRCVTGVPTKKEVLKPHALFVGSAKSRSG